MVAPFIVIMIDIIKNRANLPTLLRAYRAKHSIRYISAIPIPYLLLIVVPTLSIFLIDDSIVSAIIGLYLCYPLVLIISSITGLAGASVAVLIVGFASATATLIHYNTDDEMLGNIAKALPIIDQFIYIQLFLTILVFTALTFVAVMAERDRAYAEVERRVEERTEELREVVRELREAKRRAENADSDKAGFLSFLCHELRNPLHAVTNMTEFLVEDLRERRGWGKEDDSSGGGGVAVENVVGRDVDTEELRSRLRRQPSTRSTHSDISSSQNTPYNSVRAIQLSSSYMLSLINDVLDYGRYEAGRVEVEHILIDLHQLLELNFACAMEVAKRNEIAFNGRVGDGVPRWVRSDPVRFQQVLNNFVSNAVKFTHSGGRIEVNVDAVGMGWCGGRGEGSWEGTADGVEGDDVFIPIGDREGNTVRMGGGLASMTTTPPTPMTEMPPPSPERFVFLRTEVVDTGIGMATGTLKTLFRPYAQATVGTMREYGGSGLGLAITDKIVRCMGGRIEVKTRVGKGSTFAFTVPVGIVERDQMEGVSIPPDRSLNRLLGRKATLAVIKEMKMADGLLEETEVVPDQLPAPPSESISHPPATEPLPLTTTPNPLPCPPLPSQTSPPPPDIPLSTSQLPPPPADSLPTPPITPPAPTKRILVVDDSKINRAIVTRMLKRTFAAAKVEEGAYEINEAENGVEALERVDALRRDGGGSGGEGGVDGGTYDVIFMDILMPLMDGFEATAQIRARGITTPIIIATANQVNGNEEAERRMKGVGADEAIGKPFSREDVEAVLRRYGVL
ncbi:hypothetical protein HDV00_005369 [Rhizophlyctis rosea]|nr:hypothetical protein HDV00_005369 [Rhizophlyctis rosea]